MIKHDNENATNYNRGKFNSKKYDSYNDNTKISKFNPDSFESRRRDIKQTFSSRSIIINTEFYAVLFTPFVHASLHTR